MRDASGAVRTEQLHAIACEVSALLAVVTLHIRLTRSGRDGSSGAATVVTCATRGGTASPRCPWGPCMARWGRGPDMRAGMALLQRLLHR